MSERRRSEDSMTATEQLGYARIAVWDAMRELRELVETIDIEGGPRFKKLGRLDGALNGVRIALRDFGDHLD